MDENMITSQDHQSPPHRRMKPPETAQPPPAQKCPRCDSSNTKFCYYNNYSLSQPRYFCKACRRYWTHGGTLRNVPIGGGCRKSKRPKTSANPSSSTTEMVRAPAQPQPQPQSMPGPIRPLNFPGMDPGQGSRTSFYTGGTLLTSLTGMQTLTGLHHPPSASLNAGVVGRYGANMGLLQLQANNNGYFASHQHQGLVGSWTQSFVNRGVRNATGDGGGQAGTSFNANNQWSSVGSSHHQGFNHPRPRPPPPQ